MCKLCERVWPLKPEWSNKHLFSFGDRFYFKRARNQTKLSFRTRYGRSRHNSRSFFGKRNYGNNQMFPK